MKEPKIRFKEFEGEWEDHTLGDFGHISMCKRIFKNQTSPDGDIPFFKIGTFGYTPDAYISRKLYEEYRQLYPFPHKGDILISAAGTIGRTVEYMGEDAYYQDSNIVWLNHSNDIDNKFLKYLYSHTNWNNLEGATIKRLYNSILLSTKSNCPSLAEQQKIASFFTTIDAQISASTSRLASLKQIKAASLQSMFPQEGETTPRVRFKGFEGEWEETTIGKVTSVKRGIRVTRKNLSDHGLYPVYQNTDYPMGYYNRYNVESNNPFVIIGGSAGLIGFCDKDFWAADDCAYFCDSVKLDKSYLYRMLLNKNSEIKKNVRGSSVPRLDRQVINDLNIVLPSIAEQRAIASYFTNLDRQITLQSQRLEKLKQIKAACLDKMFV